MKTPVESVLTIEFIHRAQCLIAIATGLTDFSDAQQGQKLTLPVDAYRGIQLTRPHQVVLQG